MTRSLGVALLSIVLCLGVTGATLAQAPAPAAPPAPTNVIQVLAPSATGVAVSDTLGLLAVSSSGVAQQLSVYKLDAAGKITGDPQHIKLPNPASLSAYPNRGLSVLFHPTLPVLYVWQDTTATAPAAAHNAEFNHLLVFTIADGVLTPAMALGRGAEFMQGREVATLAMDPKGQRIFLPNLQFAANRFAAGFYELGADGLPVLIDGVIKPTMVEVTALGGQTGTGIVATNRDAVILSLNNGPATWDTTNRLAFLSYFPVHPGLSTAYICGGPDNRRVYGVSWNSVLFIYSMLHSDGYLTMKPTVLAVSNTPQLAGGPVVMPGSPARLAMGAKDAVLFFNLDREGNPTEVFATLPVLNPAVRSLAWSNKFKQLYAPVEKMP